MIQFQPQFLMLQTTNLQGKVRRIPSLNRRTEANQIVEINTKTNWQEKEEVVDYVGNLELISVHFSSVAQST